MTQDGFVPVVHYVNPICLVIQGDRVVRLLKGDRVVRLLKDEMYNDVILASVFTLPPWRRACNDNQR